MLEEFEAIAAAGFNEVYLRDLTFGIYRSQSQKFCELLIKNKVPLSWVCTTRVDMVDEDFLSLMKDAGCRCIEFGIESGIDATKDMHRKGIKNAQVSKVFDACRKLGIETAMFVMIGFPEENMADIEKSLQLCFELKGDFLALNVANVLPGTDFERSLIEKEKKENGAVDVWHEVSYDSQNFSHPVITNEEMKNIYRKTIMRFYFRPGFILNRLFKLRSCGALMKVMEMGFCVIKTVLLKFEKEKN